MKKAFEQTPFLCKAPHSLLALRMPDTISAPYLGAILNSQTIQKHNKYGTKKTTKRPLVFSMKGETGRQRVSLFDLN